MEDAGGGLVAAILGELAGLLERLAADPNSLSSIDLRAMPLSDGDRRVLHTRLGAGEVRAAVALGGWSHVDETAYAGVWWVRHEGDGGDVLAEQLVVARVPDLLLAHPADIDDAARRLRRELVLAPTTENADA